MTYFISYNKCIGFDYVRKGEAANMTSTGLIVMDMQTGFLSAQNPGLITRVNGLICESMNANQIILLVHYIGQGHTLSSIRKQVKHYEHVYYVWSFSDDKCKDILVDHGHVKEWKICGVNIDVCIFQTIDGFHNWAPDTHICLVPDACGAYNPEDIDASVHLMVISYPNFSIQI